MKRSLTAPALLLAWAATFLFRVPALLNAGAVNSDAAVVGLQARHMLRGEWSAHLWGAGYQSSLDALLAALAFALAGARPIALIAVPFLGMMAMVALTFAVLRKRAGDWAALVAVLVLAFAPMAINMPMLYVMRQTMITVIVASLALLDGAPDSRRAPLRLFSGCALAALGPSIDTFAIVLMPAAAVFALATCAERPGSARVLVERLGACGAGFALGALPLLFMRTEGAAMHASVANASANLRLLWDTCLPFALGYKVFVLGRELHAQLWQAPRWVQLFQQVGAVLFALGVAFGLAALPFRRIPWAVRRLGLLGGVAATSAVGAFLLSSMPVDMWSSRYLAPMVWLAPFALAPAAYVLRARWFAALAAPYLLSAALGGWLSYGTFVDGPTPLLTARGLAADEDMLRQALLERGVHHGAAQYWLAYRLTFLFNEDPVIVPLFPHEDRYAPYREGFDAAKRVALIFHPSEPRATAEPYLQTLRATGAAFEQLEVEGFTVLIATTTPK